MRTSFFPLKKLRRNAKYLLLFAVVMTGVFAAYLEFAATTTSTSSWNDYVQPSRWNDLNPALRREVDREFHSDNEQVEEGRPWESSFRPQLWRPEYKGQANLHIFEDWCGGSTAQLRKNLHYPLYPHSRTTVKKLAVSPRWTNYGLRIFGYLHPHTDGEYRFAVASDDNSEFWLSTDDSPLNVRLLALVGKTGTEWTAPGEFGKYSSQTSHPVKLTTSQRYYFEVIHKQNDKGTDHVEVAWQLRPGGMRFTVIASEHISLYTNESALMMTEVSHIPQTAASHVRTASERRGSPAQNVDILREDRRDTLHQLPLIDEAHLRNVLPECSYSPTYIIKDFPLVRYQGLQFVRMSYIYPNDYTRLTHMETDNKCFYHANAQDLDSVGFSRYMRMDFPERLEDGRIPWDTQGAGFGLEDEDIQYEEDQGGDDNEEDQTEDVAQERSNNLPDYGDDYDDYAFNRKRKLFSMTAIERPAPAKRRKRQAKANIQEPPAQVPDTNQKEDQEVKVQRKKKSRRKSQIDSNGGSDVLPPNPLPAGKNASGFEMANKGSHAIPVQELGLNTSQIEHHLVAGGPKANIVPLENVNSVKNRTLNREVEQPAPPPITNLQAPPAGHLVLHVNRSREIVPVNQIDVQENFVKQGRISKDRGRFHRRNEVLEREESELDNTIDQILQKPPAKQANREANEGRGERGRPLVRKANRERNNIELEQDRPLARKSNRSVNDVKIEQDQPLARKANREGNDIALERDRPLARQANREGNVIVLERDRPLAREAKRGFNDVELDRDRPLPRKYNISVNDVKIEQGQPLARKANGEGNDIALERDRPLARQANREGNDIALERAQPLARQANREGNVITLERDRPLALEAERGFNDVELEWDRPIARKSNISVNDVEIEQGQPLARKANREVNDEESEERRPDQALEPTEDLRRLWAYEDDTDEDTALGNELMEEAPWDPEVNWRQTFDVDPLDFHTLRSDWIDLNCNVSGNLLLKQSDALAVVAIFMDKLNKKHPGRFALLQVVNVEKRLDGSQGSRYLLELELLEQGRSRVRLSRYVYMAQRRSRPRILGRIKRPVEMVLCDPQGLAWNPSTTVHFIVPVKNQARWVKQFIVDMEDLYRKTKDKNFNIIITDYSSTDMDVEQELKTSAVPRYQYVKLSGNFERSAGLQAGIDLITDNHSIVFLCDLHIHFPPSIIDSIRKHCVEGKMAFAPIVMRLNCGATPQEPTGYWEVNGFGLLGIYKSDLDTAGGMNTKEFRDRWGGEDWELLDRILQAGLEVERIYLRNFMHHYHSKRGMWNRQTFKAT